MLAIDPLENQDGTEIEGDRVRGIFRVELFEPMYDPGHKAYAHVYIAIRNVPSPIESRLLE